MATTPGIQFVGIDPETPGGNCPAAFVDGKTGDLLLQGWTVTDPAELAMMAEHSPLLPHESIVRIPARMADIVRKACEDSARAAV